MYVHSALTKHRHFRRHHHHCRCRRDYRCHLNATTHDKQRKYQSHMEWLCKDTHFIR